MYDNFVNWLANISEQIELGRQMSVYIFMTLRTYATTPKPVGRISKLIYPQEPIPQCL